ncbi:MAG: ABC transporter permease [Acidobacteria bacterium]|nr:ABC transporter permease [Acidobacteriota bacterium]
MKRSRVPLYTTIAVLVFFYLPVLVLVINSFNASRFSSGWEGFTLEWYRKLWGAREIWHALRNTLIVATVATTVSTVLGTTAAFALHRYTDRLQRLHYLLIYTPLVIPEILMGMSLLLFFVAIGFELGLTTIILSHVTFSMSYVTMTVLGRLQDFDWSLIEAAQDLGADWWTTIRRVLLPLLAPLSIDDFVITFFVAGPGSTTLPVRIYSMIKHGQPPLINALSTLLLVVTFATVWLSQRLMGDKR